MPSRAAPPPVSLHFAPSRGLRKDVLRSRPALRLLNPVRPRRGASGRAAPPLGAFSLALAAVLAAPSAAAAQTLPAPSAAPACPFAPVLDADFPDPELYVDAASRRIFVLGTNVEGPDGRLLNTPEVWAPLPGLRPFSAPWDALPRLPSWARPGFTWAPALAHREGGPWRLYFTARYGLSGRPCIGVATAEGPEGPFTPTDEAAPLVCPLSKGGAIDPSVFTDADGTEYLLWKTDANCCAGDPEVDLERLSADGLALEDAGPKAPFLLPEAHALIRRDQPSEGQVVEAPTLVRREGRYVLFYSAGDYTGRGYEVAYATSPALLGPYVKAATPLLSTPLLGVDGPGGQALATGPGGGTLLAFHAWKVAQGRRYRALYFGTVTWGPEGPAYAPFCPGPGPAPLADPTTAKAAAAAGAPNAGSP